MAKEETEFKQVWEEAFSLYQKKTGRDLKSNSVLKHLQSTDALLEHIDTHEHDFEGFRQRKAKLWAVLRGVMRGVELVGSLTVNALTLTPFSYASPVLGAVLFLVTAAKGVSEAYDSIIDLLSQLAYFTGRLQEYTKAAMEPKLRKLIVDILTSLLEIFARSEKLIRETRFKQYISVTFLGGNEKVAGAKERLRSLVEEETRLVGSLTYSTALRTSDMVDRTETIVQKTDRTTERNEKKLEAIATSMSDSKKNAKETEDRELLHKTLDDKLLAKVREMHDSVAERRLSGTGDWIQSEPLYRQWIQEEAPILWILGGPGAGKSYLSSGIIANLQEIHPRDLQPQSRVSVAYFYIKEDDQQLRSVNAILKATALQLATYDSVFRNFAVEICRSPENISTAKRTWDNIFLSFFNSRQSRDSAAFVLIDGLDEAPRKEREIFLELLHSLERLRSSKVVDQCRLHFALVGRPELREGISSIWDSQIIFIEVSAAKNSVDIKNYIWKSIDRVKALKNPRIAREERKNLRENILQKLEQGANGMFLWVNLMLDQIFNKSRPSDITMALNAAPRDLDKMIRHVFERIASDPDVDKADLNEILVWVTFAQERLTLGEMDAILKMRPPIGEGMPDLEDKLRGQFASFFKLTRADNLSTEQLQLRLRDRHRDFLLHKESHEDGQSEGSNTIDDEEEEEYRSYESPLDTTHLEFSHASVRDFLLQESKPGTRKWPTDLGVGVAVNEAQHHITAILLQILCAEGSDIDFADVSLSGYAIKYCFEHLKLLDRSMLDDSDKRMIIRLLFTAFHRDTVFEKWINNASIPYGLWAQGWLADDNLSQCVRDWFANEAITDHGFTSDEISQAQAAAKSTAALFEPMALFCAREWIGPDATGYNLEVYVWFLHVFMGLNEPEGRGLPDLSVGLEQQDLSNFSLARLRLLSHFGEFEKSSRWHRGFARIAREAGYINAALRELHTSLGYDGGNIVDMEDIALCYAAQKRYAEAIKWELKALATLANGSNEERAQGLQRITQWRQETGDGEGAMQAIREAMSLVPEEIWFIYDYIMLLDRASKYEEMIDLAGKLQEMSSRSKVEDMLSVCLSLSSVEEALARAARTLGKSEFLINACQKALSAAEKTGDQERVSSTSYYLTKFRYRYERNYGSSTHLWEDLLEKLRSRGSLDWYEQMKTINALSQLYYDEAVDAEADDQAVSVPISKLEAIAKQSKAAETAGFFAQDSSSLLLGRWYFLHGNLQEARACFKLKILEAIDILTDEYPENDAYGFIVLAQVLRKAGDDLNAAAAISVGMAPIEKLKAAQKQIQGSSTKISAENNVALVESAVSDLEESAQQQPETCNRKPATAFQLSVEDNAGHPSLQEDGHHSPIEDFASLDMEAQIKNSTDESFNAGLLWSCDGECRRKAEDWQGFYICDVCYEVSFCDECLDLVKGDKLGFRMCNPSHSFWQVYPFDAKLLDVATEKVNGKVVPRATWLEKLREEWAV